MIVLITSNTVEVTVLVKYTDLWEQVKTKCTLMLVLTLVKNIMKSTEDHFIELTPKNSWNTKEEKDDNSNNSHI